MKKNIKTSFRQNVVYYIKTLGLILSYLLMGIGLASWLLSGVFFSEKDEIPLGDITGFVVDSQDNIYFASGFYQRVQAYNGKGQFIKNWNIEASGGFYTIDITENDNILITTARGGEQIEYDKNGKILSRKNKNAHESQNKLREKDSFTTESGTSYKFKGSLINELVKTNPEMTIIKQSLFLQIIRGPLNCWVLFMMGILFAGLFSYKKNNTVNNIYKIPRSL